MDGDLETEIGCDVVARELASKMSDYFREKLIEESRRLAIQDRRDVITSEYVMQAHQNLTGEEYTINE